MEVILYFKSGNKIKITCDDCHFEYSRENLEYTAYKLDNCKPKISFHPSQLDCYTVIR